MKRYDSDVLVIGSGIAGLSFALKAARSGRVALITKKERAASSTNYAQGGIAAVVGADDSFELHVRDTLVAGAGLCHAGAVRRLVEEAPARVRDLIEWGVRFTQRAGSLAVGREGGHSRRRVVHAADFTGREIERALLDAVGEERAIELFEDRQALDLLLAPDAATGTIRCVGARTLDRHTGEMQEFRARVTLLATGGLGRVYRHTTNPDIATGDGVAMAWRAGARVANLEFVQFHPTALYPAEDRAVLISEAVRGEGAVLLRMDGSPLMEGLHPLGSLATRDVVARAIDSVLKETGDPHVLLDLSPIRPETIEQRFPSIFAETQARGLDIRREPIPVVPAAHYACGGVQTDWSGRTSLPGLFAVGEVAHTGVHGANRLASNSLLEAVVYSHRCAEEIGLELVRARPAEEAYPAVATDGRGAALAAEELEARAREIRSLMWEDAGIVRSDDRLAHAERRLGELQLEVEAESVRAVPTPALAELRNLCEVAWLIVRSARSRRESRGLHFNRDHPHGDNERFLRDTVLVR